MTDSHEHADDTDAILADWNRRLSEALGLDPAPANIDAVLGLAGVAARAVVRPAAPLTTYLVGYAAGLAAAAGASDPFDRAAGIARSLAAATSPDAPA